MADDQPPDIADRVIVRQALTYCEKPLVFCCKVANSERDIYEMALLICGGKENFEKAPTIVQFWYMTAAAGWIMDRWYRRRLWCWSTKFFIM